MINNPEMMMHYNIHFQHHTCSVNFHVSVTHLTFNTLCAKQSTQSHTNEHKSVIKSITHVIIAVMTKVIMTVMTATNNHSTERNFQYGSNLPLKQNKPEKYNNNANSYLKRCNTLRQIFIHYSK